MANKKSWSQYQQAIFDAVSNPDFGSFCVNAVAGSGKTTTIVESAFRESQKGISILFLAFNKSAVNNIIAKVCEQTADHQMPHNLQCKTLHSHGFGAILSYCRKKHITINKVDKKWADIIPSVSSASFEDDALKVAYFSNISDLLEKCRLNLVKSGETRKIAELAEHFGIDLLADEVSVVSTILNSAYKVDGMVDFCDMISTSAFSCSYNVPKYDLVFVDEAQDLNKAQQTLLKASLAPNGRFVAVGDPKQAINGFAGADCDSFYNLAHEAGDKVLPLSVCYRCGKKIIDLAKTIVPAITAFEGAEDGEVRHTKDMAGIKKGDMVLCRKSAPLVDLCLKMIASGIPANVAGKDICRGLVSLIDKTKARTLDTLFKKLYHQIDLAVERAKRKGLDPNEAPFVSSLRDKVACLDVVSANCNSVADLISKLNSIFVDTEYTDPKSIVTLSTIHKAKGLEADNVFIVLPNKLPLVWKGQLPWQYEQEENLCYVAYTRAKKVLTFVDLSEDGLANYQF